VDAVTGEAVVIDVIEHSLELGTGAWGGISSFGRDLQGELYVTEFGGDVVRIGPASAPPNPPRNPHVVITGNGAVVRWDAPNDGAVPLQYQLAAGSGPGLSDRAVVSLDGSTTTLSFAGVPPGTYFVRMRSIGQSGPSGPSTEVMVVVTGGGCTAAPPAPTSFVASVHGRLVRLFWDEPGTANGPTAFAIEAGSQSGVTNLALIPVDGSLRGLIVLAPPGRYFVRLRAVNACGTSGASGEILVVVF
jgi:hypothetical protein